MLPHINQAVSAIKALFRRVLVRPREILKLPRPKARHTLPTVVSREEVLRVLAAVSYLKHKTILGKDRRHDRRAGRHRKARDAPLLAP